MLNRFSDKATHSIDKKGRLVLPKDVRAGMRIKAGDTLCLLPVDAEPAYLEVRTRKQWEEYAARLREDEGGEDKKDAYRYAMMFKVDAKVDGQGRVLISNGIREICKLEQAVTVINMSDYFEVWCHDHFNRRYADIVRAFKKINDRKF